MLHPFDFERFARQEIERRLQEAEAQRLAKLAAGERPNLTERALDSLGDLLIEAGTRLKKQDSPPDINGLRWAEE